MLDNSTLSVIIRFHNTERLALLDESLFSLSLQFWRDIEVVVVIQNGTEAIETQVTQLIESQPWLSTPRYQVLSFPFPSGIDGRSSLMNHGITNAKGRYLAFLDDDDYVYQHGYRDLIQGLKENNCVLAAGGCRVSRNRMSCGHWYTFEKAWMFRFGKNREDLFIGNFIPIHSYVIDRSRVAPEDLWFDDQFSLHEDYDFLLRLAVKYSFDFSLLDNPVCEYRYHDSNSLKQDQHGKMILTPKIQRALQMVESRKDSLTVKMTVRDLIQILQHMKQQELLVEQHTKQQELLIEQSTKQQGLLIEQFTRQKELLVEQSTNQIEQHTKQQELLVEQSRRQKELLVEQSTRQKELLIEQFTKQNRSLNKIVDKIYDFVYRRGKLISVLVICSRAVRKAWVTILKLTGQRH